MTCTRCKRDGQLFYIRLGKPVQPCCECRCDQRRAKGVKPKQINFPIYPHLHSSMTLENQSYINYETTGTEGYRKFLESKIGGVFGTSVYTEKE